MNDIYVSLENGEVSEVDGTSWDLAFQVNSFFGVGIRINDGRNSRLYSYPNGDINDWSDVDTSGLYTWNSLHNGLQIWDEGAFNVSSSGANEDYSWGVYTGPPDHLVVGDSLYIVRVTDGDFKKLKINELDAGTWNFTIANIDGSDELDVEIVSADFPERNFVYYSLSSEDVLDLEPASTSWDLNFTRYFGMTGFGPGQTSGVLSNFGVEVIQADEVDVDNADWGDYVFVSDDISVVGNDWKYLNDQFEWQVVSDRCYFVKNVEGAVYKLIFTDFAGGTTGDIDFTAELISAAGIEDAKSQTLGIYPNPSADQINIVVDMRTSSAMINVYSMAGQIVLNQTVTGNGLTNHHMSVNSLPAGIYILEFSDDSTIIRKTFVVK